LDARESKGSATEVATLVERLMEIMEREIQGTAPSRDDFGPDSIARLNLDSLGLVGFLVAVEDEFKIEWDPDVDAGVMRSFDAMARYLLDAGAS
jgi:acyl carrier protein